MYVCCCWLVVCDLLLLSLLAVAQEDQGHPTKCNDFRADYLECLHHRKEVRCCPLCDGIQCATACSNESWVGFAAVCARG
jgi:hypothetical protein